MDKNKTSGGVGVLGILLIVFVVLKLCKLIDWSWWWVLSPLWLPFVIVILIVVLAVIFIKGG